VKADIVLRGAAIGEVAAQAARCEQLGFAGIGVTETSGNPFLAAAMCAGATESARLATGIALAFPRTPMDVAYTAWDLQALSGGRFALGLGTQVRAHIERRYGATWSKPAARMREFVLALHAIWDAWESGGELAFEGEFYRHTLMPPNFRPRPLEHGRPPVLLAGVRERMLEVCGEVADGLLCHSFQSPEVLREITLPAIERGLERGGRERADIEIAAAVFVAPTSAEWEAIRTRIAFYGSTPGYRHVLDHHGLGGLFEELHARSRAGDWAQMPGMVDDDVVGLFAVRDDDPAALAAAVRDRCDGIADRVCLVAEATPPEALAQIAQAL
jgi:probable F420-dependent oxidoreductase